jgi:hypothetical protein
VNLLLADVGEREGQLAVRHPGTPIVLAVRCPYGTSTPFPPWGDYSTVI